MGLTAVINTTKQANDEVTLHAIKNTPCVLVDCANSADPHRYHAQASQEQLRDVHVISVDLLYDFREVIKQLPRHATTHETTRIIITTQDHLFNYQDDDENAHVQSHIWRLLSQLSTSFDLLVAVRKNSIHETYARIHAQNITHAMGHTTSSQRQVTQQLTKELRGFIQALPAQEQARARELLERPLQRLGAITSASSLHTWAFLLLCIILESERCG